MVLALGFGPNGRHGCSFRPRRGEAVLGLVLEHLGKSLLRCCTGGTKSATEGACPRHTPSVQSGARSASGAEQLGLLLLEFLVGERAFLVQLSELLELLHGFGTERP